MRKILFLVTYSTELMKSGIADEQCCTESLDNCCQAIDKDDCVPCEDYFGIAQAALKFFY